MRETLQVVARRIQGDPRAAATTLLALGCLGLAAEWRAYLPERPGLAVLDAFVATAWITAGIFLRGAGTRTRGLFVAVGTGWLLGDLSSALLFLHRGPLVHVLLAYPDGRLRSAPARAAVIAAYVDALADPGGRTATLGFVAAVVVSALLRLLASRGSVRASRAAPAVVAGAVASVLVVGALTARDVVHTYEVVLALSALVLFADLHTRRWSQAAVTGLVIDLGNQPARDIVRDKLARAIGDGSLVVGYLLPGAKVAVDETGQPVTLPAVGGERVVTRVDHHGRPLAVLIHDRAALAEPELLTGVRSALAVAVRNAQLQADLRARVHEIERSTRRLVDAAEAERHRLAHELRNRVEPRLAETEADLVGAQADAELLDRLERVRDQLRRVADGLDPAGLEDDGLAPALRVLADQVSLPISLAVPEARYPPEVERCAWFVCAEALANVTKHARATQVCVTVAVRGGTLHVEVSDDGVGGADPDASSGLRRLSERVEGVGGRLTVESRDDAGTRVLADFELGAGA